MGNSEEERKGDRINNAFLSSMTFASGTVTRNCDCDECGLIPIPIANAIRQHKRRRNTTLTRTQDRSLVARADDLSVWKLTMPLHAEPLVEFGNSHRIVLIDTLSSVSIAQKQLGKYCTTFMSRQCKFTILAWFLQRSSLMSIGKGIIGSSDEENSRTKVDWKEGMAYLVPPNGGKALGWVHSKDDEEAQDPIGHAIMYTIKIPVKILESNPGGSDSAHDWVRNVIITCRQALPGNAMDARNIKDDATQEPWVHLDKEKSLLLWDLIHELIENVKE